MWCNYYFGRFINLSPHFLTKHNRVKFFLHIPLPLQDYYIITVFSQNNEKLSSIARPFKHSSCQLKWNWFYLRGALLLLMGDRKTEIYVKCEPFKRCCSLLESSWIEIICNCLQNICFKSPNWQNSFQNNTLRWQDSLTLSRSCDFRQRSGKWENLSQENCVAEKHNIVTKPAYLCQCRANIYAKNCFPEQHSQIVIIKS